MITLVKAEFSAEKGVRCVKYTHTKNIRVPRKIKKKIKKLGNYLVKLRNKRYFLCIGKRIFEITNDTKVRVNKYCAGVSYPVHYFKDYLNIEE